jgi:hypothetical protein
VPETLAMTVPSGLLEALKALVREAMRDELTEQLTAHEDGFLDVDGAADFLATTANAVRALVKSERIPVHRTPAGRLLFDRDELRAWVMSG